MQYELEIDGYYIKQDFSVADCKIIGRPNQGQILCRTGKDKFFIKLDNLGTDKAEITQRADERFKAHVTPRKVIMTRNIAFCPKCHGAVLQDGTETNFCHRCGQAVCF